MRDMTDPRRGFTLVEMLVVIGITTLFAAMAIGYSHVGENENALTVETAKIAEMILQARELALATYGGSVASGGTDNACGFGVHIDYSNQTYSLFAYEPSAPGVRCPSLASTTIMGLGTADSPSLYVKEYDAASWQMSPAQGVELVDGNLPVPCANAVKTSDNGDVVSDIMFYPPDPVMLVNYADIDAGNPIALHAPKTSSVVCLETADSAQNSAAITVNPEGQVSF